MPGNPYGNLAGVSDPSIPGWQRRAFERVKGRQKGSTRHTERQDGIRTVWDVPFRVFLDEACRRRGMSMQGYCRRAIAAFVAHDLGIPVADVGKYMPIPTPYKVTHGVGRFGKTEDNLTGYGKWVITGLEDAPNESGDEGI